MTGLRAWRVPLLALVMLAFPSAQAAAQEKPDPPQASTQPSSDAQDSVVKRAVLFTTGAVAALAAHEAGHLAFNVAFDADPTVKRVEFAGIPFFALTHRRTLSPRREAIVASAGFWVQHATNEWLLTARPDLRRRRAPFAKGVLAFNLLTSAVYSGAAFARTGPFERDTRALADAARIDERWVGVFVLAPAAFDAWRYFEPESKAAVWLSRGAKIAMVGLVLR